VGQRVLRTHLRKDHSSTRNGGTTALRQDAGEEIQVLGLSPLAVRKGLRSSCSDAPQRTEDDLLSKDLLSKDLLSKDLLACSDEDLRLIIADEELLRPST